MTDQDVRDFLERMTAEEPLPFFDAEPLTRRARRRAARTVVVAAVGVAAAVAVVFAGVAEIRTAPAPVPADRSDDLGIFAPVAGRIVFTDSGLWGVEPNAPSPESTLVRLDVEDGRPLGWSSDGTELLLRREDPTDQTFPYAAHLSILHADGTETQLNGDAMLTWDATIAPDGSRVVFAAADDVDSGRPLPSGLFVVDAEGDQPVRIAEEGYSPTFSPDGTQIAYLTAPGKDEFHVWIADADGSDAHEILADEPAVADGPSGLAWSPAGDRIAMDNTREGHVAIYTFAPDGSDFTRVITGGMNPFWSPDGSQIAYMLPYGEPLSGSSPGLAIADADGSNVREFGFGASGPWHPGTLQDTESATEPVTPTPSPRSEAEQIIAEGAITSFAANGSGTVLTVWAAETCEDWDVPNCAYAWRLGTGSQPLATGVVGGIHGGYVEAYAASGDGFVLTPSRDRGGFLIAPDGTAFPLSGDCRDATWSAPTEPRRLGWAPGLSFVDTVAGVRCPTSRLGGRPLARGVFTADGTLWALVDNETGPDTLAIGRYDGAQWRYHDFAAQSGSWTSVLAAAGSNVVVLLANPEPSPRPDQLVGFAVTTDDGATWSEVLDADVLRRDLPFSTVLSDELDSWFSGYTSMAFAGTSTLYVADGNGDLWRSTDFTTFSQVEVAGSVSDLKPTGDAVIARLDEGNDLVRISADGSVEPITVR